MRTSVVMITGLAVLSAVGCHRNKGGKHGSDAPQTEQAATPAPADEASAEAPKGTVTISSQIMA